ncbi:hypothetical protein GIB67_032814, partial [Kingdonia uniflora]
MDVPDASTCFNLSHQNPSALLNRAASLVYIYTRSSEVRLMGAVGWEPRVLILK